MKYRRVTNESITFSYVNEWLHNCQHRRRSLDVPTGELTMKYHVEYRNDKSPSWIIDDEFESRGEAMSYATSEALDNTDFEHRVTMQVTVMTYPRLEDFA